MPRFVAIPNAVRRGKSSLSRDLPLVHFLDALSAADRSGLKLVDHNTPPPRSARNPAARRPGPLVLQPTRPAATAPPGPPPRPAPTPPPPTPSAPTPPPTATVRRHRPGPARHPGP